MHFRNGRHPEERALRDNFSDDTKPEAKWLEEEEEEEEDGEEDEDEAFF